MCVCVCVCVCMIACKPISIIIRIIKRKKEQIIKDRLKTRSYSLKKNSFSLLHEILFFSGLHCFLIFSSLLFFVVVFFLQNDREI